MKQCVWILFSMFFACSGGSNETSGTEIGNPRTVAVKIVGVRSFSISPVSKMSARTIASNATIDSVSEARIVFKELKFIPGVNCNRDEDKGAISLKGPFVSNLITSESVPSLNKIDLAGSSYCKIKFKLDELELKDIASSLSSSDPIIGHSLRVAGKTSSGKTFEIRLRKDVDFEIRNLSGFTLTDDLSQLLIAFDLDAWLENIDFSAAAEAQGQVILDEQNNKDLYAQFLDNLKKSSRLLKDQNNDGEADDGDSELADSENN